MPDIKVEQFPFDAQDIKGDSVTFKSKQLTVSRVWTRNGTGYSFAEDMSSPSSIWNMKGEWDDATRSFKPYVGPTFNEGDSVNVVLRYRQYTRRDGGSGEARDVVRISPAQGVQQQAAAPAAAPAKPQSSVEQQIKLGMAFNNLTAVLSGSGSELMWLPEQYDAHVVWQNWFIEAAQGKPLTPLDFEDEEEQPEDEEPELEYLADYESQAKEILKTYFGFDKPNEAKAWMEKEVGAFPVNASTNERNMYWMTVYLKAKDSFIDNIGDSGEAKEEIQQLDF